jgi:hypothetical protein
VAGRRSTVVAAAVALLVVGGIWYVFLRGAGEAGQQIAETQAAAIDQIANAQDAQAESGLRQTMFAAQAKFAENGSFPTAANLAEFEPNFNYTDAASGGPREISVYSSQTKFGAAAMSDSGTCLWMRTSVDGAIAYGRGRPCTGQAALGATDPES